MTRSKVEEALQEARDLHGRTGYQSAAKIAYLLEEALNGE